MKTRWMSLMLLVGIVASSRAEAQVCQKDGTSPSRAHDTAVAFVQTLACRNDLPNLDLGISRADELSSPIVSACYRGSRTPPFETLSLLNDGLTLQYAVHRRETEDPVFAVEVAYHGPSGRPPETRDGTWQVVGMFKMAPGELASYSIAKDASMGRGNDELLNVPFGRDGIFFANAEKSTIVFGQDEPSLGLKAGVPLSADSVVEILLARRPGMIDVSFWLPVVHTPGLQPQLKALKNSPKGLGRAVGLDIGLMRKQQRTTMPATIHRPGQTLRPQESPRVPTDTVHGPGSRRKHDAIKPGPPGGAVPAPAHGNSP
jgi:hypothetical protein